MRLTVSYLHPTITAYMLTMEDLPAELLVNEIFGYLDVPSILSYCRCYRKSLDYCQDVQVWCRYFEKLTYRQTQDAVLYWSRSGLLHEIFYSLLPSLIDRLDLRTVGLVYLYSLEQKEWKDADNVKSIAIHHYNEEVALFFDAGRDTHAEIMKVINAVKTKETLMTINKLHHDSVDNFRREKDFVENKFVNEYMSDIIVATLNDNELLEVYKTQGSELLTTNLHTQIFAAIVRASMRGRQLLSQMAKDTDLGALLIESRSIDINDYRELYRRIYGTETEMMKRVPRRERESLLSFLQKPFYVRQSSDYIPKLLNPSETIAALFNNLDKKTRRQNIDSIIYNAQVAGYTVWLDEFTTQLKTIEDTKGR